MPREALRVAVPVGVDRRREPVPAGARPVVVHPEDLAVQRRHVLRERRHRRVAEGDVQQPVRPELHARPVVDLCAPHVVQDDDALGELVVELAIAHHAVDGPGRAVRRVAQIDVVVGREIRMERQPHRPALAGRVDVVQRQRGRGQQLAVLIDAHPAWALREEQTAVGREGHRPGDLKVRQEHLDAELRAVLRRERLEREAARRGRRRVRRVRGRRLRSAAGGKRDQRRPTRAIERRFCRSWSLAYVLAEGAQF